MRASSQKHKLNRKPSATSKEAISTVDKEERLQQLRSKIEKERQAMRRTGKRFSKNGDVSGSQSKISVDVGEEQVTMAVQKPIAPFFKRQNKVAQSSAKQQSLPKQQSNQKIETQSQSQHQSPPIQAQRSSINLSQLIPSSSSASISSLSSSHNFQKQINEQKNRNIQIHQFLANINLGEYAQGLINMGYDQLQVLMEIKSEQLNFLMMRAPQQRRLMQALNKLKQRAGIVEERKELLMGLPALFKTRVGMKAPAKHVEKTKHMEIRKDYSSIATWGSRPKSALTETETMPTNNSNVFGNYSFFSSIGGTDWSIESLVRRGCSTCFKVFPSSELEKRDECYYCKSCKKLDDDLLGLTLSDSMLRDYSQ